MKTIGVIIAIVLAWFILWKLPVDGIHYVTGSGEHTGYVTAVEKTGLIFKTYTAYVKSDVSSSQEDLYCVIGEDVVNKLKENSENKTKTTLKYIEYLGAGFKNCNAEASIIVGIK